MAPNNEGAEKKKRKVGRGRKKSPDEKRFEEMTSCLTEQLFEIATGQCGGNGEKGGAATLSERLKAAELLARYRKNSGEGEEAAAPALIIDDIG